MNGVKRKKKKRIRVKVEVFLFGKTNLIVGHAAQIITYRSLPASKNKLQDIHS